MPGEFCGALALAEQRLFDLNLLFVALLDQQSKASAFLRQGIAVSIEPAALFGDAGAQICKLPKIRTQ